MDLITSRAVIGEFYKALNAGDGAGWINLISNYFASDQSSETYAWLGQSPAMREWVGGRNAKGFSENSIDIKNLHYEATIEILKRDLTRDKSGQVMARIRELAARTNSHWPSLLSTLILNGASTDCYDGQFFFDTDHEEGKSGAQSNDVSVDISALAAAVAGTTTAPSVEEMQGVIATGIATIGAFVDDQGEPMNENANSFLVMVPPSLYISAVNAVATPMQVAASQTAFEGMRNQGTQIMAVQNPRLSTMTESVVVFRTDSEIKSFIRQEETGVQLAAKAEGSEFEFDNDAHQYGVDSWRNVGYGYWQNSALMTMV